jgi:hypothetical protein
MKDIDNPFRFDDLEIALAAIGIIIILYISYTVLNNFSEQMELSRIKCLEIWNGNTSIMFHNENVSIECIDGKSQWDMINQTMNSWR